MNVDFSWWPHKASETVASYRLRCAQIIAQLRHEGLDCGLYEPDRALTPKVLVLSKRYDAESVAHATDLRARAGTRIALDLCDNHFFVADDDPRSKARAAALKAAVDVADLVIASTETLAEAIGDACPKAPVIVIGDAAEAPYTPAWPRRLLTPAAELELAAFAAALPSAGKRRRLLWFGNHVSTRAEGGMLDLDGIYPLLERLNEEMPLSVTIVSNSRKKYAQLVERWRVPNSYLRWRRTTISRALRLHEVALIPISVNAYTRCKTNNRLVTALLHDLGVVADSIPSYEAFADAAVLDDWEDGLRRILTDESERRRQIEMGKRLQLKDWTLPLIAQSWRQALVRLAS